MKRISVIDGLRGLALLGILLINITFFNQSLQSISLGGLPVEGTMNHIVDMLNSLFMDTPSMLLYSFLFGYGAILLFNKTIAAERRFAPLFLKRMLVLLIFGIIHGTLIWYGDILTTYAITGLLLLLFIRRSPKTILIWSIICTLCIPLLMLTSQGSGGGGMDMTYSAYDIPSLITQYQEKDMLIYGNGTFMQILVQRINDYISGCLNMLLFIPQVLGAFLLGAYCAKKNLLSDIKENKNKLIQLGLICGTIGIVLQIPKLLGSSSDTWEIIGMFIASPLLMLSYVALFSLLFLKFGKALSIFCNPGRIGLSMYILQSVLCGLIFYSYGLGLFGKMELWQTELVAILIFTVQIVLSSLYLRRFKTGPIEYVWRLCYRGKS
ncbi:hypothetical protein D3C73_615730 [compost metagenome]